MLQQPFILAAYLITAALLAILCLTTWMRARKVKRQLREAERHET